MKLSTNTDEIEHLTRDLWAHPTGAAAVDAADLYGLLTDLALSADTDDTALMLHGVLLHTDTTSAGETVLAHTTRKAR